MAELLVKAKPHWMDNFTQEKIDSMSIPERRNFEARSQIGDIVVVRPDGWQWGKKECLPNFVIIKLPGLSIEEAKKYEEQLHQDEVITKTLEIDKKDWEDSKRKDNFIQSQRFVEIPTIKNTKEVERVVTVSDDNVSKISSSFKYSPVQLDTTKPTEIKLKGVVDVHTVEGQAINTYLLKHRKHQIDPTIIKNATNSVLELKDVVELTDKLIIKSNI